MTDILVQADGEIVVMGKAERVETGYLMNGECIYPFYLELHTLSDIPADIEVNSYKYVNGAFSRTEKPTRDEAIALLDAATVLMLEGGML